MAISLLHTVLIPLSLPREGGNATFPVWALAKYSRLPPWRLVVLDRLEGTLASLCLSFSAASP